MEFLGSFLGPSWNGSYAGDTIAYGGYGLAFNAANNSLFVIGHGWTNFVSEITIPDLSLDPKTYKRATFIQKPVDVTEGKRFGDVLTGLLVYHDRLILSSRVAYDANSSQNALRKSHYVSGLTLGTSGDAIGPLEITAVKTNYLTGYMASVPTVWQGPLGGPALTGWCCGPSIIGRTSLGPAVSAFDPDKLGEIDPVPGVTLLYYPLEHPTIGTWGDSTGPWPPVVGQKPNLVYNGTAMINGMAFPDGYRTVLFIGTLGQGIFCYGDTTGDINKVYTEHVFGDGSSQHYCAYVPGVDTGHSFYSIDPVTKGFATTLTQVWAYDVLDLIAVREGSKKPWEIKPYATWALPGMGPVGNGVIRATAYDAATSRLYIYQSAGSDAIVRVYGIKAH